MNTVIKMDRSGIRYLANQEKKAQAQQQYKSKPKPKRCFEYDKKATLPMSAKLHHHNPCPNMLDLLLFNAHYMFRKDSIVKIKVMFLGPPNKNRSKKIWVAKSLVEKVKGPQQVWAPKQA